MWPQNNRIFVTFLTLLILASFLTASFDLNFSYMVVKVLEIPSFMPVNLSVLLCRGRQQEGGIRSAFLRAAFCIVVSFALIAEVYASELDGYWQHPDDPVWIEVNVVDGTGVAMRNDDQPETVGFHVVRGLIEGEKAGSWRGEVYVPQFDSYKNVTITMPDEQTLKMTVKFGFIRRSVAWSRVDSTEAGATQ